MTKILLSALLFAQSFFAIAQCENGRYRDLIFTDFVSHENVEYGANLNFDGTSETLLMDIYEPEGDSEPNRPLVIMAHGGFFVAGDKDGSDIKPLCIDLAKMGYVTASINYRLGFPIQLELEQPMSEAVLRGVHDMKAAIRWFRKNVAESGNTYSIDPDQIYIGGVSAGGFIALQLAYVDEMDELPSTIDFDNPGLGGEMEGLSGNDGYPSHVNAIINIAGALSDTTFIHPGDEPACLFHGTEDTTVPFGSETLVIAGTFPVTEVDGSESVNEKLEETGIEHCFEIYEGQGHVPHDGNQFYYDTTLSVISNFLSHFVCGIDLDCSYREILVGTGEMVETESAVFPNPASDIIRLSNFSNSFSRVEYKLLDMQGQRVAAGYTVDGEIEISNLAPGIYMLNWSGGEKNFSATVSIVR